MRVLILELIETRNRVSVHGIPLSKCIGKCEGETSTRVNCRATLVNAKNKKMVDSLTVNS